MLKKFSSVRSLRRTRSIDRQSTALPPFITGFQKFYRLLSPIFEQPVHEAIMREIIWTEDEMCNRLKDFEKGSGLSFWDVLISRIHSSFAGQFIEDFNGCIPPCLELRQLQLDVLKENLKDPENQEEYETMNNIVDDMVSLLTNIFRTECDNVINLKTFLGYLDMLRLTDSRVGCFDEYLTRLDTLQVLILGGNLIEVLRFDCLPPTLRILELNNNLISEINIKDQIGPRLVYLGLSSNCFSDESVMEGLLLLDKLCVLDLSDNNFTSFQKVSEIIRNCPYLECICLRGNPLSTVESYKEIIKVLAPSLHQLDGWPLSYEAEKETQKKAGKDVSRKAVPKKEKEKITAPVPASGFSYTAELRIYVFRMMGIPKPTEKNKKLKGYFQFEVQLPLLDQRYKVRKKCNAMFQLLTQSGFIPKPSELPHSVVELKEEASEKPPSERKSPKKESHSRGRKHADKEKKKEPWEIEYELFLSRDKATSDASCILSEKMRWSPFMKPRGPIAVVKVKSANLPQLRYTLKSVIIIRLYFNYEISKDDGTMGKRLMAKISVPAQEPHWKDEYCSYEWNAKQPQIATPHLTTTTGNVRLPSGSRGKQRSKSNVGWTIPTCHLGIGLHRIG